MGAIQHIITAGIALTCDDKYIQRRLRAACRAVYVSAYVSRSERVSAQLLAIRKLKKMCGDYQCKNFGTRTGQVCDVLYTLCGKAQDQVSWYIPDAGTRPVAPMDSATRTYIGEIRRMGAWA